MKVGIFVGNMSPTEGGAYTLLVDQLSALNRLRKDCGHTLTLYHYQSGESFAMLFPEFSRVNMDSERSSVLSVEEKIAEEKSIKRINSFLRKKATFEQRQRKLRKYSKLFGGIYGFVAKPRFEDTSLPKIPWDDRIYKRDGVQFLIRLAPITEGLTMDIPFAMVLWDLQHRNNPWFPEVSAGQEWQRREQSYIESLRRATVIYVGTVQGKNEVMEFYQVPPERFKVLPFAIPTFAKEAAVAPRNPDAVAKYDLPENYLFYPAQFWAHKNHVVVLEACKIVRDETGWDLGVVFSGADKGNQGYVRDYARRLGIERNVRFVGFIDQVEVMELYRGAFSLVFPTYCGPDNLPPLEAFAAGCPVIASEVDGAREQLGDAAMFFPPSDEKALAKLIVELRLLDTRARMISAGQRVVSQSSWDDYARGIVEGLNDFAAIRRTWM